jgi:hypothetical protein
MCRWHPLSQRLIERAAVDRQSYGKVFCAERDIPLSAPQK